MYSCFFTSYLPDLLMPYFLCLLTSFVPCFLCLLTSCVPYFLCFLTSCVPYFLCFLTSCVPLLPVSLYFLCALLPVCTSFQAWGSQWLQDRRLQGSVLFGLRGALQRRGSSQNTRRSLTPSPHVLEHWDQRTTHWYYLCVCVCGVCECVYGVCVCVVGVCGGGGGVGEGVCVFGPQGVGFQAEQVGERRARVVGGVVDGTWKGTGPFGRGARVCTAWLLRR